MNQIGFCTIRKDLFIDEDLNYIKNFFKFFDISISQIGDYESKNVLSVQSIFFLNDTNKCSLVKSDIEFYNLLKIYQSVLLSLYQKKYKSIIFGSPKMRVNNIIDKKTLYDRIKILMSLAVDFNIKLYFESLPNFLSDIFNKHEDLLKISKSIHLDTATWISNNRSFEDLKKIIHRIDRYHLSVPGYGHNFHDYPITKNILKLFNDNSIRGTFEIQRKKKDEIIIEKTLQYFNIK
tara:strand:- start:8384 stop:9088 length:705 start_codon:yes stop_codon:yes gene_type:complete